MTRKTFRVRYIKLILMWRFLSRKGSPASVQYSWVLIGSNAVGLDPTPYDGAINTMVSYRLLAHLHTYALLL